jgi:hypothetical protein
MDFKTELKSYLKTHSVKPFYLSKQAGLSPSIISLFLSGKRGITLKTCEKIKAVMDAGPGRR